MNYPPVLGLEFHVRRHMSQILCFSGNLYSSSHYYDFDKKVGDLFLILKRNSVQHSWRNVPRVCIYYFHKKKKNNGMILTQWLRKLESTRGFSLATLMFKRGLLRVRSVAFVNAGSARS